MVHKNGYNVPYPRLLRVIIKSININPPKTGIGEVIAIFLDHKRPTRTPSVKGTDNGKIEMF